MIGQTENVTRRSGVQRLEELEEIPGFPCVQKLDREERMRTAAVII